jgi:predicted ATPase
MEERLNAGVVCVNTKFMIKTTNIKNFKSIKDSGKISFTDKIFVLAGQNESGKSSILEALSAYENEKFERDTLNFEEEQSGNLQQEVSCVYTIENKDFFDELIEIIKEEFSIKEEDFFVKSKLKTITEYTITKIFDHTDNTLSVSIDSPAFSLLRASLKTKGLVETTETGEEVKTKPQIFDIDEKQNEIAKIFFRVSPQIILFNTFSDLLPDKILISDLEKKNTKAEGYNAVKNLEGLLDKDFVSISKLQRTHKSSTTSIEVENLSSKFQKAWKQRIYDDGDLKIGFEIENENVAGQAIPTVFFSIQTKDNVLLEPRKRSKGMIWFLSAWLDLKAREDGISLVILYDEPGLYLHVKAHKDILGLFNELIKKGHQVVYSTHSPSLIDTSSLYNIGLVLNTKEIGTIVEGLTTSKINTDYKQDALQPVAEAMGLEPLKDFSVLSKKNVLLEGLSDFWYFQAMAKILGKTMEYKFVPGIGIKGNHIYHLISFCIGYGLGWVLVMDNGVNPQNTRNNLQKDIFDDDISQTNEKIKLVPVSEIEDMFSIDDLRLVDNKIKNTENKKPSAIIGHRKIVFARDFARKSANGEITKVNLTKTTVKNFEEIFDWIDQKFANI